jgi:hypothetical protein
MVFDVSGAANNVQFAISWLFFDVGHSQIFYKPDSVRSLKKCKFEASILPREEGDFNGGVGIVSVITGRVYSSNWYALRHGTWAFQKVW